MLVNFAYIYDIKIIFTMKKLFFAFVFALTSVIISCKKETTSSNTNSNEVTVSSINCASATTAGKIINGQPVSNVTVTIPYTGGNGKTYLSKSHNSTGVSGLSATLQAGTLADGEGTLVYTISGTPSSAGSANFAIALGGKSCTITIVVDEVTQNPTIGKPGPNITDSENNTYKTVFIGTQQWMAENLKVSKYNDGTVIPNVTDNTAWSQLTTGALAYYNNDVANNSKYGKLYNWFAVSPTTNGNKNVCPSGWHVPTDAEWTVLKDYLGGENIAGGKMKEVGTTNWISPNTDATNKSLFTGLPGGFRGSDGFLDVSLGGFWWSSSESDVGSASLLLLSSFSGEFNRSYRFYKGTGLSVRCLRD
jgi:uncharacterized protein (TIGR02145 family)